MAAVVSPVPEVVLVNLDVTVPADKIAVALMQPYLNGGAVTPSLPYHWQGPAAERQLASVERTMDISRQAGCTFTVFPEYSLPGVAGVEVMERRVVQGPWRENTVVIAGVDGLSETKYRGLWNMLKPEAYPSNDPNALKPNEWANVCLVWTKDRNGNVRRWIQPKLRPSGLERPASINTMFNGRCVYVFECQDATGLAFRFFSLLCSDWFRRIDGTKVLDVIRRCLQQMWSEEDNGVRASRNPRDIHLAFVPQCNEDSNRRNPLEATRDFLSPLAECGLVHTDNCAVVFANTAGRGSPGPATAYGKSGVVFDPGAQLDFKECRETYAVTTRVRRNGSDALDRCKEALLREDGGCVHTFGIVQSQRTGGGSADRTPPLVDACVYPLADGLPPDNRAPSSGVHAMVKWTLDEVESARPFASNDDDHPLRTDFDDAHETVSQGIRAKSPSVLVDCPYVMSPLEEDKPEKVDEWDGRQRDKLETTLQAIELLHVHAGVRVQESPLHGDLSVGGRDLHVLIVTGSTHPDCRRYALTRNLPGVGASKTLLLTHDGIGRLPELARRDIFEGVEDPLGAPEYARPETWFVWRGLQEILEAARDSQTVADLRLAVGRELRLGR